MTKNLPNTNASKSELLPYLKQYGSHCMAYTSLEPELEYFLLEDVGYIAFKRFKDWFWSWRERLIVLADPICAPEDMQTLLVAFLQQYPRVTFVQSSRQFAELLDKQGLQVNQFGVETDLLTADFSLAGKSRAKLRQWRNKCQREGLTIVEKPIGDFVDTAPIKALSQQWLDNKGGVEYSFLVRPLRYDTELDARYFWAYSADKRLLGMAIFDPIYRDNEVVAYYHNLDRIDNSAPHGTSASIVLHALETFKQEGKEKISLGMSPLCLQRGMSSELNHNAFTRQCFWYAFDKLNYIYPFKGNASHKAKFNGEQQPIYISSTQGTNLWQVLVMMKGINMF